VHRVYDSFPVHPGGATKRNLAMKKRKASKGPDGAKQAGPVKFPSGGITIGDYPNSKNIRAWMRLYFGWGPMNTDIRFTYWRKRGELPDINTASDVLRFGLSKGCTPTDAGRAKAFELGLLSDDSPAVLIPATQANTAGRGTAPGKKPGASPDVQKLRDKLYDARQVHILKAGAYTAEAWETWIPKFIKGLRPKSLLNAKIYYENRGTFTAKELDAKQWEALYKREHARRHKNAG